MFCVCGVDGACRRGVELTALEQQDCYLTEVEVDEMARLVRDVRSKVSTYNAMPCWVILFVELFLDECGNVLRKRMSLNRGLQVFNK